MKFIIVRSQHLKDAIKNEKERIFNDQEKSINRIMRVGTIKHQRKIIETLESKLEIQEFNSVQRKVHWSELLCEYES